VLQNASVVKQIGSQCLTEVEVPRIRAYRSNEWGILSFVQIL
jgi:hypothetical protein